MLLVLLVIFLIFAAHPLGRWRHYVSRSPSVCVCVQLKFVAKKYDIYVLLTCKLFVDVISMYVSRPSCLQCFDVVGWAEGRASGL